MPQSSYLCHQMNCLDFINLATSVEEYTFYMSLYYGGFNIFQPSVKFCYIVVVIIVCVALVIVFIVCSMIFIFCVVLCAVFCLSVVCYFVRRVLFFRCVLL
jgi:hypothetical protein